MMNEYVQLRSNRNKCLIYILAVILFSFILCFSSFATTKRIESIKKSDGTDLTLDEWKGLKIQYDYHSWGTVAESDDEDGGTSSGHYYDNGHQTRTISINLTKSTHHGYHGSSTVTYNRYNNTQLTRTWNGSSYVIGERFWYPTATYWTSTPKQLDVGSTYIDEHWTSYNTDAKRLHYVVIKALDVLEYDHGDDNIHYGGGSHERSVISKVFMNGKSVPFKLTNYHNGKGGYFYDSDGIQVCTLSISLNNTVSFDANGGSTKQTSISKPSGETIGDLLPASRTGYDFLGWFTAKSGGTQINSSTIINTDVTYYAHWNLHSYKISYSLSGGAVSNNPSSYNINTEAFTLNNPTRAGYTFTGWSGSNGSTPQTLVTINKGSTGDRSYTSNWRANTYKIEFISAGDKVGDTASGSTGSTVTGTMAAAGPYTYDQSYNLPKNQFVRTGYKFEGWTQNKDGSGKVFPDKGQFSNLTAADNGVVKLYAKWSAKTYQIKYILHGFTLQNPVTEYTVEDNITIPDLASPDPSKKEFRKWISYEAGAGDLMPGCKNIGYKNNVMTIPKGTYGNLTFEVDWTPVGDGISSSEPVINHFKIKMN